jgi:hypothetical protein
MNDRPLRNPGPLFEEVSEEEPSPPSLLGDALRRSLARETDPLVCNWFAALLLGGEKERE